MFRDFEQPAGPATRALVCEATVAAEDDRQEPHLGNGACRACSTCLSYLGAGFTCLNCQHAWAQHG